MNFQSYFWVSWITLITYINIHLFSWTVILRFFEWKSDFSFLLLRLKTWFSLSTHKHGENFMKQYSSNKQLTDNTHILTHTKLSAPIKYGSSAFVVVVANKLKIRIPLGSYKKRTVNTRGKHTVKKARKHTELRFQFQAYESFWRFAFKKQTTIWPCHVRPASSHK